MVQLKGIDVSNSNGIVDWNAVKAAGVQFAMIRLGYGGNIPNQDDKQFARNVAECERVGIPWGAYLYSYALSEADAMSEVAHARRLLAGKSPKYPIAFDMEDADGYKQKHGMPSNQTLVNICYDFLASLEADGHYTILYASKSWLDNQLNDPKLDRFNKWVAQWNDTCTYGKNYCLWQYTDKGNIGGKVFDMNYSYIDFANRNAPQEAPKAVEASPVSKGLPENWEHKTIGTLTVNKGVANVNIRLGNSTDAPITRKTSGGDGHAVFGWDKGWYNISSDEWIIDDKSLVTFHDGAIGTIVINSPYTVNIHNSPSFDSPVTRTTKAGDGHKVYEEMNGLYRVTSTEWITANPKYIKFSK
jgi:GH25 family lysozyme M1 (1,4-beta-N-acetylmuramidase)